MPKPTTLLRTVGPILAALATLLAFHFIGTIYLDDYELELGRLTTPARKYTYYLGVWFFFGTVASGFLTLGIARLLSTPGFAARFADALARVSDQTWIVGVGFLAFAMPVAIRVYILEGAPLTDDESAYSFMAELLASGRLYVESHETSEAFDRKFMINDGKMYAQYFIGWPALMVPGVWVGRADLMNPLYSGLTVVPLFYVVRRAVGRSAAKASSILLVSAPMLIVGAATGLAHTSCLAALAWLHLCVVRSTDDDAPYWTHAAVAALFGIMFFNRPTSALGAGVPLLGYWFYRTWSRPWRARLVAWTTFGATGAAFGAAFLGVNYLQNGDPLQTAYGRAIEFAHETKYRNWAGPKREGVHELFRDLDQPGSELPTVLLATLATAALRLNFACFGWPCSYLFALFAWSDRNARLAWASLAGVFVVHAFVRTVGVDSIGPLKYFEAAFPLLVLSGIGLHRAAERLERADAGHSGTRLAVVPTALLVALVLTSAYGYTRIRLRAVADMAARINIVRDGAREAGIHQAVVFTPRNFSPNKCSREPTRHFVFVRPNNDPDLQNDVLWVNHRGLGHNRRLSETFPDRTAYLMQWNRDCTVTFKPFQTRRPTRRPNTREPPKARNSRRTGSGSEQP